MSNSNKWWDLEPMDSFHVEIRGSPENIPFWTPPPPLKIDQLWGSENTMSHPSAHLLLDHRSVRDI
jgi:hypothetical protein